MERGEGADTPDSLHRLTPKTPTQGAGANTDECPEEKIKLPLPSSSKPQPLPSINGEIGTEDSTLWVQPGFEQINQFDLWRVFDRSTPSDDGPVSSQDLRPMWYLLHRHVVWQAKKKAVLSQLLGYDECFVQNDGDSKSRSSFASSCSSIPLNSLKDKRTSDDSFSKGKPFVTLVLLLIKLIRLMKRYWNCKQNKTVVDIFQEKISVN